MNETSWKSYALSGTLLIAVGVLFVGAEGLVAKETTKVRWLIAHEPVELFERATQEFSRALRLETGGELSLEVLTASDVGSSRGAVGDVPVDEVLALFESGDIELASTIVAGLGERVPALRELDLPFRFVDVHDTFETLDGETGASFFDAIREATELEPLAFTLSGGMRVLVSNKELPLERVEDFAGKTIITTAGPVGEATFEALGASVIESPDDVRDLPETSEIDAVEVAYSRIAALDDSSFIQHVYETNHSIFLTTLLARAPFLESLSPEHREAFVAATKRVAALEREDSVELAREMREKLAASGVEIHQLSASFRSEMRAQTSNVYDWFERDVGKLIISR